MLIHLFCGLPVSRATPAFGAILLCLLTSACFSMPERPVAGPDPSDSTARAPATAYRPVLGEYVSQRPIAPSSWREQNDRVAPQPKNDR